jgi:hypothetical protein
VKRIANKNRYCARSLVEFEGVTIGFKILENAAFEETGSEGLEQQTSPRDSL